MRLISKYQNGGKPYQQSQPYNETYEYFLNDPRITSTMDTKIPSVFASSYQRNTTANIPYSTNDQDWLKYWYKNRRRQLSNMFWYPHFDDEDLENYVYNGIGDHVNREIDAKVFSLNNAIDYAYSQPVNYTNLRYGTLGQFDTDSKEIKIDPNQSDYSTNLHEHVHKLNDKIYDHDLVFSNDGIYKISPIEKLIKGVYNKQYFNTYLDAPYEIYSRLMTKTSEWKNEESEFIHKKFKKIKEFMKAHSPNYIGINKNYYYERLQNFLDFFYQNEMKF